MRYGLLARLLSLLCAVVPVFSSEVIWQNPPQGAFPWWGISQTRDAIYLAAGSAVSRSVDGHDWTLHYEPDQAIYFSIAQSPDKILAAANTPVWEGIGISQVPTLYIATNGVDFKRWIDPPRDAYMYSLVYGKGRFVGSGFKVWSSDDGVDWRQATGAPSSFVYRMGQLIFEGGRFVQAADDGTYVSEDGVAWSRTGPGSKLLSYYDGTYVAVGPGLIAFSSDAHTWSTQTLARPNYPDVMAIGASGIVVVGDSRSQTGIDARFSPDRTNWVKFTLPFVNEPSEMKDINGEYLMVGDGGLIAHSTDGTNWTSNISVRPARVLAAVKGGDRVIGVGLEGLMATGGGLWSTDGTTWQTLNLSAPRSFLDICYGDGRFVAVGHEGQLAVSTNGGNDWIQTHMPGSNTLSGVTASPRGFIMSGRQTLMLSPDGLSWEPVVLSGTNYYSYGKVVYGNGIYLLPAARDYGAMDLYRSEDLKTWTLVAIPTRAFSTFVFGNGRFVTASGYSSIDGVHWEKGDAPSLAWIGFSEGMFCGMTGGGNWYDRDKGYVSADGLHWHEIYDMPHLGFTTWHFFGRFFGFAGSGGILEADNFGFVDAGKKPDGSLELLRVHPAKFNSRVETSTDMKSWTTTEESLATGDLRRFFRLRLEDATIGK